MSNVIAESREEWLKARKTLLEQEKQQARANDELAASRRQLPKLKVDKDYIFDSENGAASLADLFAGKSQLIIQHFMFGKDWDAGCPSCSFWADGFNPMLVHMSNRDMSFVAVSSAPIEKLVAYQSRMGWSFPWVSSGNNSFNMDFDVTATERELKAGSMNYNYRDMPVGGGEYPGASVFSRNDDGTIYHHYSTYARGLDRLNAAYAYLDLAPKGRGEDDLPWPMAWLRRSDEY